MNNLHLIVRNQFPEFIREDYPVFVAFIQAYYKWIDDNSVGKLEEIADLDKTPEQFVEFFRTQLDSSGLFNHSSTFNNLFLQKIKQIYTLKGSEQALVNVLRLSRQIDANITYPSKNILKASDGKWKQDKFITVERILGTLPDSIDNFYVLYQFNEMLVSVTKTEILDSQRIRLYFKYDKDFNLPVNQTISIKNSSGTTLYTGKIITSPSKFRIVSGGKYWQLGQTVVIPGSVTNTVARVSEIDSDGSITRIEILQYGYDHLTNELIAVSPYAVKPPISTYNITSELVSTSPVAYHHTLDLYEYTDGVTDRTNGVMYGVMGSSYFLEDYTETSYTGTSVLSTSSSAIPAIPSLQSDITMEQWLESRALLRYEFGDSANIPGRWSDEAGQPSNQTIRLQDNYYYQQFSYDIEAETDSNNYASIASALHPAGSKMFTTYNIVEELTVTPSAETTFPYIISDKSDIVTTNSQIANLVTKARNDIATPSEEFTFNFEKALNDDVSSEEEINNAFTKATSDTSDTEDVISSFNLTKYLLDQPTIVEEKVYEFTKLLGEEASSSEQIANSLDKYLSDSATASSDDTSTFGTSTYDSETYFAESYVVLEKTLTIGV